MLSAQHSSGASLPWQPSNRARLWIRRSSEGVRGVVVIDELYIVDSDVFRDYAEPDRAQRFELFFNRDQSLLAGKLERITQDYEDECEDLFEDMDEIDLRDPVILDRCLQSAEQDVIRSECGAAANGEGELDADDWRKLGASWIEFLGPH